MDQGHSRNLSCAALRKRWKVRPWPFRPMVRGSRHRPLRHRPLGIGPEDWEDHGASFSRTGRPKAGVLSTIGPTWSPDGKTIFFYSSRNSPRLPSLRSVPADGGPQRLLVDSKKDGWAGLIGVTSDGLLLLQGETGILTADPGGGNLHTLVANAHGGTLSPDRTKFTYAAVNQQRVSQGFLVHDLVTGSDRPLALPAGYRPEGRNPQWSVSGKRVAQIAVNRAVLDRGQHANRRANQGRDWERHGIRGPDHMAPTT